MKGIRNSKKLVSQKLENTDDREKKIIENKKITKES